MPLKEPKITTTVISLSSNSDEDAISKIAPVAPREKKSLSFMLAFASLMATNFISIMDTVIVATALPAIAHGLNARSNEAYWAGSGFLFAQAVSQPLYGTMSSVFGRKSCLMFAMIVFTIASIFCAVAKDMTWLVAARVVGFSSISWLRMHQSDRYSTVPRSGVWGNQCCWKYHCYRYGFPAREGEIHRDPLNCICTWFD